MTARFEKLKEICKFANSNAPENVSGSDLKGLFTNEELGLNEQQTASSQINTPSELRGLFTDEELGISATTGTPQELRGLFTDEEMGSSSRDPSSASFESAVANGTKKLKKGMKDSKTGGLVTKIQKALLNLDYTLPRYGADGDFGSETESAVKLFQKNNSVYGLAQTGVVNAKTLKMILDPAALKNVSALNVPEQASSTGPSNQGADSSPRTVSETQVGEGGKKVSAQQLYNDLIAGIPNKNLCKAMVANAIAESGLRSNVNGDCGRYAKRKGSLALDTSLYPADFYKPNRGGCCSFGLWQYNICGGLGNRLLKAYGADENSPDADKIKILTSYSKQVEFMIGYVKGRIDVTQAKTVDWWVDWFVRKVERPAKMDLAVVKRQKIARGLRFGDEVPDRTMVA